MSEEFFTADWAQLDRLPPAERVQRAAELQELANEIKSRLSRISAEAIKEMADGGMSRLEIASALSISVQRVGQILGAEARPDGIDMAQLRLVAKVLAEHAPLNAADRKQAEEARKVLSKTGRVSTFEARGTAARLAYVGHHVSPDSFRDLTGTLRNQYLLALAHAEDVHRKRG
jgi:hypothetical protein